MIHDVHISGYLNKAIYRKGDHFFLFRPEKELIPARQMDMNTLQNHGGELKFYDTLKENQLADEVKTQHLFHGGLDMAVTAMDDQLSDNIRLSAIEVIESLMRRENVYQFIRTRLLSRPATEDTDLKNALRLAKETKQVKATVLYQTVLDLQPALIALKEVWNKLKHEHFPIKEKQEEIEDLFLEQGVFADFAEAVVEDKKIALDNVVFQYGSALNKEIPRAIFFFQKIGNQLAERYGIVYKKFDVQDNEYVEEKEDEILVLIRNFSDKANRRKRKKIHQILQKTERQIEQITEAIRKDNQGLLERYLKELVDFHIENSERTHLCKSLSNIAGETIHYRKYSLTQRLIEYAQLADNNDPTPYCQEAELSKYQANYPKAIKLYEAVIQRFPNDVVARTGLAEVYKSTANYAKAIELYEAVIQRFPENVVARTGLAEVYKSTANYAKAIELYEAVIQRFPNDEVARNGLAEVYKSTANYAKAIELYEAVIQRFPENVVARNGLAEVYKSTANYAKAIELYEAVIQRFPNDEVARNGRLHVFILAKKDEKVEAFIRDKAKEKPQTEQEWIQHHIISMYYVKRGRYDEAITRLKFEIDKCVGKQKARCINALTFTLQKRNKKSDYQKSLEHLNKYAIPVEQKAMYQLQQQLKALVYTGLEEHKVAREIVATIQPPASAHHRALNGVVLKLAKPLAQKLRTQIKEEIDPHFYAIQEANLIAA